MIKNPKTKEELLKELEELKLENKSLKAMYEQDIIEHKQAEELLKRSELHFRALYENAKIGLYRTNPAGTILMANKALVKMLGYPSFEKIAERNLEKDIYEPTYQREEFLEKIEKDGEIIDFESVWVRQDGSEFFVRESAQAIRDSQGKTLYYDGVVEDISERKHAEEEVRESEERFRMVFENVFDGISIYNEDPDPLKRRLIECNEQYSILAGRSRDELLQLGSTLGLQITLDNMANTNRLESLDRGAAYQGYFSWIRPDGKENVIEYVGVPIKWRGKSYTIGIDRDITERKRTEESLRESERFLKETQMIAQLGTYTLDIASGQWESSEVLDNIFGIDSDFDKTLEGWISIIHTDWQKIMNDYFIQEVIGNKTKFDKEYKIIRQNDKVERWVHGIGRLKFNDTNQPITMVGTIHDITEQKQVELIIQQQNNQLQELITAKDKFFSIIAHDLKSPFQGFLGLTKSFAEDVSSYSALELTQLSNAMHQMADNLFSLLNNLLEWAQMQKGLMSFQPQELSLSELIAENVQTIKNRSKQKEVAIINTVIGSNQVYADEKMINSVLMNLLSNAVKFTHRNGMVTISAKKTENQMIEISIRDSGVGMPKSLMEKLFKVEEKTGRKGTDGELSTGLGLLLCKEFVEKHEGKIWVESEEGVGSTFYFTLRSHE